MQPPKSSMVCVVLCQISSNLGELYGASIFVLCQMNSNLGELYGPSILCDNVIIVSHEVK